MTSSESSRWRMVRTVFKHDLSLNVGIIGLGTMGQRMLESMNGHTEFNVRYAWDLNVVQCQKVWNAYPQIQIAQSAEELVSYDDINLVYIATPPSSHVEYSELALEMGRPVLCEKPLAVDLIEARGLVEDSKLSGIPTAVNFSYSTGPIYAALRNALATGLIGDPLRVEIQLQFAEWPRRWQRNAAGWLAHRKEGGFVREVFSHFAYLTSRLLGVPVVNNAYAIYPDDSSLSESRVFAQMSTGNIPITLEGTVGKVRHDELTWTLHGSRKSVRILNWSDLEEKQGQRWEPVSLGSWSNGPSQLDAVASMVRGERHDLPNFEAALRIQQLVERILRKPTAR